MLENFAMLQKFVMLVLLILIAYILYIGVVKRGGYDGGGLFGMGKGRELTPEQATLKIALKKGIEPYLLNSSAIGKSKLAEASGNLQNLKGKSKDVVLDGLKNLQQSEMKVQMNLDDLKSLVDSPGNFIQTTGVGGYLWLKYKDLIEAVEYETAAKKIDDALEKRSDTFKELSL